MERFDAIEAIRSQKTSVLWNGCYESGSLVDCIKECCIQRRAEGKEETDETWYEMRRKNRIRKMEAGIWISRKRNN